MRIGGKTSADIYQIYLYKTYVISWLNLKYILVNLSYFLLGILMYLRNVLIQVKKYSWSSLTINTYFIFFSFNITRFKISFSYNLGLLRITLEIKIKFISGNVFAYLPIQNVCDFMVNFEKYPYKPRELTFKNR